MSRPTLDTALSIVLSLTGLSPSLAGFPKTILLRLLNQLCVPNPGMHASLFGLFRFRSPLLPESHVVFSSSGYLDVSVHRVPFLTLWIGVRILEVCSSGFPHSEISGSLDICSSPKLFAAYHVFHRLLVPRHPPYALFSMTNLYHSVESLTGFETSCWKLASIKSFSNFRRCLRSKLTERIYSRRCFLATLLHRYSVTGVGSRFVFLLRFLEGVVIINNIPVNNNYLGCLE